METYNITEPDKKLMSPQESMYVILIIKYIDKILEESLLKGSVHPVECTLQTIE